VRLFLAPVQGKKSSKLYAASWVKEVDLMRLRCKCGSCKEPDVDTLGGGWCCLRNGTRLGPALTRLRHPLPVMNLNNTDLFSHELLFQCAMGWVGRTHVT
jgi:hypothetical protein